jgi:hypothetical protein
LLWPVFAIGALMIILPFALQMPSRTAAGARMINLLVLISGFGLWHEREHTHAHRAHPTPA